MAPEIATHVPEPANPRLDFNRTALCFLPMGNETSRLRRIRESAQAIWEDRGLEPGKGGRSRLKRFAHFWVMVWRSFNRNRCPVRASALAYATLLTLIPMLAVVMSITSTFLKKEGEERIDQFIGRIVGSITTEAKPPPTQMLPDEIQNQDVTADAQSEATDSTNAITSTEDKSETTASAGATDQNALSAYAKAEEGIKARKAMARYIHDFIQNTRSGALGVTGSVLLIFAAISLLSRIEVTFNDIWGVSTGRNWFTRIVLYWGVLSLLPLLLVVALGLATGSHWQSTRKLLITMPFVGNLIFELAPVIILCLTFAAFYMLMPNTKVHWRAALAGGVAGGLMFHINNALSFIYVSRVISNSRIYGSLALVPVFMIGLYCAWLILLFGAQVAYAYQNRRAYLEEKQVENINQRGREFVALRLMACIGQRFLRGEPPPSVPQIGQDLCVPTRLIQQIMQTLASARLVVEIAADEPAFTPARPLEHITCHDVLRAMRAGTGQEATVCDAPANSEVYGEFNRIEEAERRAAAAVTILALANRAGAAQIGKG